MTIRAYVTFLPFGTAEQGMYLIMFVPFTRVPTPWASLPRSFASALVHNPFAGVRSKCLYSRVSPVPSSMNELHEE